MASKTAICNWALFKLGQERIANIDTTNTKNARVLAGIWDRVLESALQAYPWKFAGLRTTLAADGTAPINQWANSFTLPSDYLAIRQVGVYPSYDIQYEIEGAADGALHILTDESAPLAIRYTRRITNTGQFHPLFNEVLACDLAHEACEAIVASGTLKESFLKDKFVAIEKAYGLDAIETPPQELPEDEFITARQ